MKTRTLRGRCIELTHSPTSSEITLVVQNESGRWERSLNSPGPLTIQKGDLIEVAGDRVRVLTPNRTQSRATRWTQRILDPRRLHAQKIRTQVEGGIREYFTGQGFLETRTPILVSCPGMETHIRPYQVDGGAYLQTSPEFAMKRLLVGGLERIFQLAPVFRNEPTSPCHSPEFLMLEWYRAYEDETALMKDTEELFAFLAEKIHSRPALSYRGQEISLAPPWPRLKVRDLFEEYAGVDLTRSTDLESMLEHCRRLGIAPTSNASGDGGLNETWDDLYFRIWLNVIEPKLPSDRAVFVTRYPASQSALAVIDSDPDGSRWARRFEIYAGGLEIGNAFYELTDPKEQRARFIADMDLREKIYGPAFPRTPLDEDFLGALEEGLPPSAGIAVGVDRMVMLFADEPELEKTLWVPAHSP